MIEHNQPAIKHKLGLLELADQLRNVSRACKLMGVSRDTFYRVQTAYEDGGIDALLAKSKKAPNPKNRVEEHVEQAILDITLENPAKGQLRVSNDLRLKGVFVSSSGVRSVWQRHNLETFKKRLKALEEHVAKTGEVLTEDQLRALEKKQEVDIACGEIENRSSRLSGISRHLLCWHPERRRASLSADIRGYLQQGGMLQALYNQNTHHSCRPVE